MSEEKHTPIWGPILTFVYLLFCIEHPPLLVILAIGLFWGFCVDGRTVEEAKNSTEPTPIIKTFDWGLFCVILYFGLAVIYPVILVPLVTLIVFGFLRDIFK